MYVGESEEAFLRWITENRHRVDCLILQPTETILQLLENLQTRDILVPILMLLTVGDEPEMWQGESPDSPSFRLYHKAIACIPEAEIPQIAQYIHRSITQFLQLPYSKSPEATDSPPFEDRGYFLLSLQQQRLSEKLKERLGYLGIYYKRNPENFLRNLSPAEKAELLDKLRTDYRGIILNYFVQDDTLNQKIDDFVNTAFFSDASVSQIVEIHMGLMESFSTQLKLEGRSEEILLDYRLTLIDVIAHLCEMYRRSIPREM